MAQQAGLPEPDFTAFVGRGGSRVRLQYLEAVRRGYVKDYRLLTDFFVEAFNRALRMTV